MGEFIQQHSKYDVIVVGAGLSGLSSAKLLHDTGLNVLVLEASERVGGRLHTERNPKCRWVDWGGAYIGPTQTRVLRLAKEMGLEMYKVHNTGDWLYYNNGKRSRFANALPPMRHPLAWIDANNIFRKIDELGDTVPPAEPWKAKNAEQMDNMTLQEWLNKNVWTQSAMDAVKGFARVNFTAEPHEVSLLWALWYVRQAGGTIAINVTENGAQEMKFEGGAAQLPERIAEKLGIGTKVLLHHPVCKISHSPKGATVMTTNGRTFECDYLVFGNPPALQMKIEFQPSLPPIRNQLIQRVPMGAIIKTMVYYKSPFWREKGLVGTIFIDDPDPTLPVIGTMDDTKSDGSHACIMGFVLADKSRQMLEYTKEERLRVICQCYARTFGMDEFLNPIHYEEKNWMADPWTGGCYTGFMGPGFLTKYGPALRKPIDRLYFAGTESATEWTGYMEGAIQSGERAAREVLNHMGKIPENEVWQREPMNPDYPSEEIKPTFLEKNLPSVPDLIKVGGAIGAAAVTRSILKSKV